MRWVDSVLTVFCTVKVLADELEWLKGGEGALAEPSSIVYFCIA